MRKNHDGSTRSRPRTVKDQLDAIDLEIVRTDDPVALQRLQAKRDLLAERLEPSKAVTKTQTKRVDHLEGRLRTSTFYGDRGDEHRRMVEVRRDVIARPLRRVTIEDEQEMT